MHGYHRRQRARTVECNVPIPCDHMDLNVNMLTHLPLTCELMTFGAYFGRASLSTRAELRLNPVRVQREKNVKSNESCQDSFDGLFKTDALHRSAHQRLGYARTHVGSALAASRARYAERTSLDSGHAR